MSVDFLALYSERPRSGKSAIAQHLEGDGYQTFLLSQPLLDRCFENLKLVLPHETDKQIWFRIFEEKAKPIPAFIGLSPREYMAGQAKALRTRLGPCVLAEIAWKKIEPLREAGRRIVVDGLRSNEEATFFTRRGAKTVNVIRPENGETTAFDSNTLHDWSFDFEIVNDSTLQNLQVAADALITTSARPMRVVRLRTSALPVQAVI